MHPKNEKCPTTAHWSMSKIFVASCSAVCDISMGAALAPPTGDLSPPSSTERGVPERPAERLTRGLAADKSLLSPPNSSANSILANSGQTKELVIGRSSQLGSLKGVGDIIKSRP